eukprot:Gregarina_sp_Poly_1__5071@NODE_2689_length_1823_cov_9_621298_g1706_i0_p1_GENE_NODE_2689_length_1823_cov_9_621298_g1706_i0NODE_2689_length_1823_cov_9_621298_g1706_i0_p1_ORF_typecomplete_len119_score3_01_NODE_2689_length_1823_cov_9_621298_g1706_i010291385
MRSLKSDINSQLLAAGLAASNNRCFTKPRSLETIVCTRRAAVYQPFCYLQKLRSNAIRYTSFHNQLIRVENIQKEKIAGRRLTVLGRWLLSELALVTFRRQRILKIWGLASKESKLLR